MEGLFQPTHLLLIFAIALLIFGPKKLPELGKGIGEGFRALKEGMKDKPADTTNTAATNAPSNTTTNVKS
jgi:sec-independent protein translocase protein TatA